MIFTGLLFSCLDHMQLHVTQDVEPGREAVGLRHNAAANKDKSLHPNDRLSVYIFIFSAYLLTRVVKCYTLTLYCNHTVWLKRNILNTLSLSLAVSSDTFLFLITLHHLSSLAHQWGAKIVKWCWLIKYGVRLPREAVLKLCCRWRVSDSQANTQIKHSMASDKKIANPEFPDAWTARRGVAERYFYKPERAVHHHCGEFSGLQCLTTVESNSFKY